MVGNKIIKPNPKRLRPLEKLPLPTNLKSVKRVLGFFAYYKKWIKRFSEKIKRLKKSKSFPLNDSQINDFHKLEKRNCEVALQSIEKNMPFVFKFDTSDVAVLATLNQRGRPVAFMSRTLHGSELYYLAAEKEATAIIEAVRKWTHLLSQQHFTLVTDHRSVLFMLDNRKRTKIKNNKIQCWQLELATYSYNILYIPGKENTAADSLTRGFCSSTSISSLAKIHASLCHPEVTRLLHFVRTKNLPFFYR